MVDKLTERIFELVDMNECFDVYGTIEDAKNGIKDSIENDPQGVIEWLLDYIEG